MLAHVCLPFVWVFNNSYSYWLIPFTAEKKQDEFINYLLFLYNYIKALYSL